MTRVARVASAAVAAALGCSVLTASYAPAAHAAHADDVGNPVERAREAAENLSYAGQMEVHWVDQWGTTQQISFPVWGGDGVVQLGDDTQRRLAATDGERWLYEKGQWDLVASPGILVQGPPATRKYQFVMVEGKQVAGHPTNGFGLVANGSTQERLYFDTASGMLLAREQLDSRGSVMRSAYFSQIAFGSPGPRPPAASADARPTAVTKAGAPYMAPSSLNGGYSRVEVLRRPDAMQVVYSDGVHSLSVFEQPGRLDRKAVAVTGKPVAVGRQRAFQMAWPGGQIVLWQGGSVAFTVVGDGAAEDVLNAARSVPVAHPTVWQRVKAKCLRILRGVAGR